LRDLGVYFRVQREEAKVYCQTEWWGRLGLVKSKKKGVKALVAWPGATYSHAPGESIKKRKVS